MKKFTCLILSLLIFATPLLAQDTYPYYSDPEKQLLYGSKKIEIVFKESTKQIISGGGSQFNPLYLLKDDSFLFEDMPMLYNESINTNYVYHSEFKIFQNNRELSEIDFLEIIGLTDKANKIKNKYKSKMEDYYRNPTYTVRERNPADENLEMWLAIGGVFFGSFGLVFTLLGSVEARYWLVGGVGMGWLAWNLPYRTKDVQKQRERPVLKQQLSNTQITDLAESYNRRIFQEIKTDTN